MKTIERKWWVLAALTTAALVTYGPAVYAFTLYLGPLEEEFGWNRAALGGAVSIYWLSAPLAVGIGWLVDRYGAKRLMLLGIVLESAAFVMLGLIDTMWELYATRVFMGIGKLLVLVSVAVAIFQWFERRAGVALGICLSAYHVGGFLTSLGTEFLLTHYGWRTASFALGSVIAVVSLPSILFAMKDKKTKASAAGASADSPTGLTLREALRTRLFRSLLALTVVYYTAYSAILAHIVPYLSELGFSSKVTSGFIASMALAIAVAVVVWGLSTDRAPHKRLLLSVFALMAFSVGFTMSLATFREVLLVSGLVVLFGIAFASDAIWQAMLRNSFGERAFGKIFGCWVLIMNSALLVSPIIVGHIHDLTDSYQLAFGGILGLLGVGVFVISMPGFRPLPRNHAWGLDEAAADPN